MTFNLHSIPFGFVNLKADNCRSAEGTDFMRSKALWVGG
jgi:hypothetical protein